MEESMENMSMNELATEIEVGIHKRLDRTESMGAGKL
jgi:hypothetical protein